jgi:hypothetical protein
MADEPKLTLPDEPKLALPEEDKLTLDDLLVWGQDREKELRDFLSHKGPMVSIETNYLHQYLAIANPELVKLQRSEKARKPKKPDGGRPKGGMGEMVLRLMANGMGKQRALSATMAKYSKPRDSVLRAYKAALKKSSG